MNSCIYCGRPCNEDGGGPCGLCEKLRYDAQTEAVN
jgi:hypothetical protein